LLALRWSVLKPEPPRPSLWVSRMEVSVPISNSRVCVIDAACMNTALAANTVEPTDGGRAKMNKGESSTNLIIVFVIEAT
jgi:hypothetical protein